MSSIKKEYTNRIEYQNEKGECHRTDGPAIKWNNGNKEWWINGKTHREDGPAVERSDGVKLWYLNDIHYKEDQFHQEIIKIKLKRLVNL
jgi:hypothetical protein